MAGMALILSMVCLNSTCIKDTNKISYELIANRANPELSRQLKEAQLKAIANQINGKVLSITTLEDPPLSWTEKENGTTVIKGVVGGILDLLMKKFNFTYEVKLPKRNIIGSSSDIDGSILEILKNGDAEFAAAFLPIFADARQFLQYSVSLDEGEYIMIMNRPSESATGSGLLAPFDEPVWYLILVSLLLTGPLIYALLWIRWLLTKDKKQRIYTLPKCIFYTYGGLMKQGSTLQPSGDSIRLMFATWWIFITILTSFYTANLTAFLTLSKFTLPINTAQDISNAQKKFVCQRGFGIEYAIKNPGEDLNFLNPMVNRKLAEFTTNSNDTDILLTLVLKRNLVYVRDRPAVTHMLYEDYKKRKYYGKGQEKAQCPFVISYIPFLTRKRGFGFSKNSSIIQLFDPQLLHLVQGGIIKYKLNEGLPKAEICPQNLGLTERQLKLGDLFTTYATMMAGFSTATVVFFTELFFRCLNSRRIQQANEQNGQKGKQITVKPLERGVDNSTKPSYAEEYIQTKEISPPPAYQSIFTMNRYGNNDRVATIRRENENRKTINGREYMIVRDAEGNKQMIPIRQPSATIFQYTYNY